MTNYLSESNLWLNTGNGFERQEQIFSIPDDNAHWAAVGDIDGDKDLDVFFLNNSSYDKEVLSLSEVQLPQNALTDCYFVDLNNDGLKEIVTGVLAGNGGNKVFLNKSE